MSKTHGMTRVDGYLSRISPTYLSWQRMKSRCLNPNAVDFTRYGGRGIRVCERWKQSFESFLADIGERPDGMQIDQIDNNGHYEPSNCRWVTKKQNARNRSSNVLLTVDGVTRTATEWGEETGLGSAAVIRRAKAGWSPEKAVKTPLQRGKSP